MTIKQKIAALIAKAESTDNEHEEAAFMQKALDLLAKHNLERGDLDAEAFDDPMGHENGPKWQVNNSWHKHLFAAVARFYGCATYRDWVRGTLHSWRAVIYGRESARSTVLLVYPVIIKQMRSRAKLMVDAGLVRNKRMAERRMATALTDRITKMSNKWRATTDVETKEAGLIVQSELQAYKDKHFDFLVDGLSGQRRAGLGGAVALAETISITRDVSNVKGYIE